jgi:hypothetical protein
MVFNPLLDDKKPSKSTSFSITSGVKSPLSGAEMTPAFCGDIPVVVDLANRVVLPVKKV